jgi:hypothetical protein
MHRLIIATAVLLAFPATALAVNTQKAQPQTISVTANGAPRCTTLPYSIQSTRHKVILRISHKKPLTAKAVKHARLRDVGPGSHHFGWCGKTDFAKTVKPGVYWWRVGATAKAGAPVAWSIARHINVTA